MADAAFFISAVSAVAAFGGSRSPRWPFSKDSSRVRETTGALAGTRFGATSSESERSTGSDSFAFSFPESGTFRGRTFAVATLSSFSLVSSARTVVLRRSEPPRGGTIAPTGPSFAECLASLTLRSSCNAGAGWLIFRSPSDSTSTSLAIDVSTGSAAGASSGAASPMRTGSNSEAIRGRIAVSVPKLLAVRLVRKSVMLGPWPGRSAGARDRAPECRSLATRTREPKYLLPEVCGVPTRRSLPRRMKRCRTLPSSAGDIRGR